MADFWSMKALDGRKRLFEVVNELADAQREHGATSFRATVTTDADIPVLPGEVPTRLWLEGWIKRPDDQGEFNPPERLGAHP